MKKTVNFQKEIQKILNDQFSTNYNWVGIILSLFAFLMFVILSVELYNKPNFLYYVLGAFLSLFFLFYFADRSKKIKHTREFLKEAFDSIRINNFKRAIDYLIKAYQKSKNTEILEFIFLYSFGNKPDFEQQSLIITLEYDKLKSSKKRDKKIIEILKQILEAFESIKRHNLLIKKSEEKIKELREQIEIADEPRLINEFKEIIVRYENIIAQSQKRIKILQEKVDNLLKLKHNFSLTRKLIEAREQLEKLEQELLNDFIYDEYLEHEDNATNNTTKDFSSDDEVKDINNGNMASKDISNKITNTNI